MAFTDEELRYLKIELPYSDSITARYAMKLIRLEALLHRLECAEMIAFDHAGIYPKDPAVLTWMRSKGGIG